MYQVSPDIKEEMIYTRCGENAPTQWVLALTLQGRASNDTSGKRVPIRTRSAGYPIRIPDLLGDYWTRLKNRPARSTPMTVPLLSRVKKPRCASNSPLV